MGGTRISTITLVVNPTRNFFDSGSCTRYRFYTHTHTHPPPKTYKKCRQKTELGFAKCNFQNSDKKYLAYGVRTKQLFLRQKKPKCILPKVTSKINMDKQQSAYGVLSKFLKDYICYYHYLTHSSALPAAVMKPV